MTSPARVATPAPSPPALAEYACTPAALLVHDPVAAGSFRRLERVEDRDALERDFLFRERPVTSLYARQHRAFVARLRSLVPAVHQLQDLAGSSVVYAQARHNPNQVFTRDSLITLPWRPDAYFEARMREPLRRPEAATVAAAVRRLGLREILRLPEALFLEGGDVVPFLREGRRSLLVGHGSRTARDTLDFLQQSLIPEFADEIVGVGLAPWRMNLDGGLLPVSEDLILADVASIGEGLILDARGTQPVDPLAMLRDLGSTILEVSPEESVYAQACNAVCLGGRRIVYFDLCPRVSELLRAHDIDVLHVAGSELVKGRGGPRCMTRPIYAT
jgi:N-dimethylarginine dimethylaminohydrolase